MKYICFTTDLARQGQIDKDHFLRYRFQQYFHIAVDD
jgi:hypothetical protein